MHALRKNRPLRRIVLASAATVSGVVLLLSLKPHAGSGLVVGASTAAPRAGASAPAAPEGVSKTVTGSTVQTRWGPVQVRATIEDGRLTDVTAVQYPTDNPRDQEINSYALPQLRREALAAQSARIDMVSGATYTSTGYRQSLQSALDQAHG
ncbi:FMN-binding protein [Streptomyces sp. NEAU-sy36]|uniref:FMN-binding protein n=1 Tax=unclassified Streptomyces TaxID=2593676 RepID=UPI0015D59E38|nr:MULTISPECIES: FMN-binding protein [unclassified Streptomyces]QLJ01343.1 FMN-binding protein [Streptomyces sp. NEAU-sy36]